LAAVTFTPPEYASEFESEFEGYRSDSEHVTFSFQSGFGLKIWAEEAELFYICARRMKLIIRTFPNLRQWR
jgi:hypothetical protein